MLTLNRYDWRSIEKKYNEIIKIKELNKSNKLKQMKISSQDSQQIGNKKKFTMSVKDFYLN